MWASGRRCWTPSWQAWATTTSTWRDSAARLVWTCSTGFALSHLWGPSLLLLSCSSWVASKWIKTMKRQSIPEVRELPERKCQCFREAKCKRPKMEFEAKRPRPGPSRRRSERPGKRSRSLRKCGNSRASTRRWRSSSPEWTRPKWTSNRCRAGCPAWTRRRAKSSWVLKILKTLLFIEMRCAMTLRVP